MYRLEVGYRLPTKDGRVYGNCTVIQTGEKYTALITDFGNVLGAIPNNQIEELFWPPFEDNEDCQAFTVKEIVESSVDLRLEFLRSNYEY